MGNMKMNIILKSGIYGGIFGIFVSLLFLFTVPFFEELILFLPMFFFLELMMLGITSVIFPILAIILTYVLIGFVIGGLGWVLKNKKGRKSPKDKK